MLGTGGAEEEGRPEDEGSVNGHSITNFLSSPPHYASDALCPGADSSFLQPPLPEIAQIGGSSAQQGFEEGHEWHTKSCVSLLPPPMRLMRLIVGILELKAPHNQKQL